MRYIQGNAENTKGRKSYTCVCCRWVIIGPLWRKIQQNLWRNAIAAKCRLIWFILTHKVYRAWSPPWPFHIWGLDLVGPVNSPLRDYIWILIATEYFTKWEEAIPLRKAIWGVVTNFIKETIIVRFGVPNRIISDNGTSFVNSEVRKMLEFY